MFFPRILPSLLTKSNQLFFSTWFPQFQVTVSPASFPSFTCCPFSGSHVPPPYFYSANLPSHSPLPKHTPTSTLLIYIFPFLSMLVKLYLIISESLLIFFSLHLLSFYGHSLCHITFEKNYCLNTTNHFWKDKQDTGPDLEKPQERDWTK